MLTDANIEAELSYAYLHAVASRGGFACEWTSRHLDSAGVDAVICEDGRRLAPDSVLTSFEVHVQLKATYQKSALRDGRFSFSDLTVKQYDKLRNKHISSPRILVVLYLPENPSEWLGHSEDSLICKRCDYWVSLRSAPDSVNREYQTVYIPRRQVLSVEGLRELMTRFSRREWIDYEA
jgi:hypothetical protein